MYNENPRFERGRKPNLCEPEFANKAYEGRAIEIRPCIGCGRCLNGIMFGKRIACTINPSFELENEDTLAEAEVKKDILVCPFCWFESKRRLLLIHQRQRLRVLLFDCCDGRNMDRSHTC